MEAYNTRVVRFPDGVECFHYSTKAYKVKTEEERAFDKKAKEWEKRQMEMLEAADWVSFAEQYAPLHDFQGRPIFVNDKGFPQLIDDKSILDSKPNSYRKKVDNLKRAKQKVYDIARSNSFDLFITFTFNPDLVDSFDYECCVSNLQSFTKLLRRHGCSYVLVPEKHPTSGRWHFHGLCTLGSLSLVRATHFYTGEDLSDKKGRAIYNLPQYSLGHSTATFVSEPAQTASYLCEYLTKDMEIPHGKKCYWASRSCARPEIVRTNLCEDDLPMLVVQSRFVKAINNEYGDFLIAERLPDG